MTSIVVFCFFALERLQLHFSQGKKVSANWGDTGLNELPLPSDDIEARPWGLWATVGFSAIIFGLFSALQVLIVIFFLSAAKTQHPELNLEVYAKSLSSNGFCLATNKERVRSQRSTKIFFRIDPLKFFPSLLPELLPEIIFYPPSQSKISFRSDIVLRWIRHF